MPRRQGRISYDVMNGSKLFTDTLNVAENATIAGNLTVDGSLLTPSSPASLIVERHTDQSITFSGTGTIVDFDVLVENVGSFGVAAGVYTIPIDGLYNITTNLKWEVDSSNKFSWITVSSNAGRRYGYQIRRSTGATSDSYDINDVIRLSADDTVSIYAEPGAGTVDLEGDGTTYAQRLCITQFL